MVVAGGCGVSPTVSVRVVCDSTADLDDAFRDTHRIEVVPLQVIIIDQSYRDGVDITPAELYLRMRRDGVSARTSQPTPAEFEAVFRAITDAGDAVVCTTISSGLSGTYGSASQAAEALVDRPIRVIDTRSVSVGHYAAVTEAVRVAEAGGDLDAVAAAVDRLLPQIRLLFTVETLEYLRRGGRIGGARALLGSMLDVVSAPTAGPWTAAPSRWSARRRNGAAPASSSRRVMPPRPRRG